MSNNVERCFLHAVNQPAMPPQTGVLSRTDAQPAKSQVICIASGKGGTGKTMVACNLAAALSSRGRKIALVDADFGFANAHLLLGMKPRHDLSHVLQGTHGVLQVLEIGPMGIRLVSGSSGSTALALLTDAQIDKLLAELACLEEDSEIIIFDLSAGISPHTLRFLKIAHDIFLVGNHESTAKSDLHSTIDMLAETLGAATVHLIINMARDRLHATTTFQQIWHRTNQRWRGRITLYFSGWIPQSPHVQRAILRERPLMTSVPRSLPSQCLDNIATRLEKHHQVWKSRQVGRWGTPSAFSLLNMPSPN